MGRQATGLGPAGLWVLPNPSGLNANHQLPDLAAAFRALREAADAGRASRRVTPVLSAAGASAPALRPTRANVLTAETRCRSVDRENSRAHVS